MSIALVYVRSDCAVAVSDGRRIWVPFGRRIFRTSEHTRKVWPIADKYLCAATGRISAANKLREALAWKIGQNVGRDELLELFPEFAQACSRQAPIGGLFTALAWPGGIISWDSTSRETAKGDSPTTWIASGTYAAQEFAEQEMDNRSVELDRGSPQEVARILGEIVTASFPHSNGTIGGEIFLALVVAPRPTCLASGPTIRFGI